MKKSNSNLIILASIAFLMLLGSCKKTSQKPSIANKESADSLLTGAYSILVGYYHGQSGPNYGSGITNWSFGGIGADDVYIGSTPDAQSADLPLIEDHSGINADNVFFASKWQTCYAGVVTRHPIFQRKMLLFVQQTMQGRPFVAQSGSSLNLVRVVSPISYISEKKV
jgi:starch-binding outer membrane protein, SusD/RagB family